MAEISNVAGGLRLLQALAAAETAESMHGSDAKVDLDVLWIFIGKVGLHGNELVECWLSGAVYCTL